MLGLSLGLGFRLWLFYLNNQYRILTFCYIIIPLKIKNLLEKISEIKFARSPKKYHYSIPIKKSTTNGCESLGINGIETILWLLWPLLKANAKGHRFEE
jgi:hypothetical protein